RIARAPVASAAHRRVPGSAAVHRYGLGSTWCCSCIGRRTMRQAALGGRWHLPRLREKNCSPDSVREFWPSGALRAAADDWSGALLFALGFAHELLKTREVGHPEVATLAAQQTDRGKPA